jgi:uncharacterized protein YfaP (DUF2135 family)
MAKRVFATMSLLAPCVACAQVTLDSPKGGWRNSADAREEYSQTVNYPASSVNLQPGQSATAQIRGRIAGADKGKPATLVVNGVSMPVEVQEDGSFARPYSFGRGANGVEVRSPDGKARARAQFYDAYEGKTQSRLRVVLSWDTPGTDLDLHVVGPDGAHAWYGNRVMPNGGALDVDVTTGYGPEIFSSAAPLSGTYHVYVNYYGSGQDRSALTVAQVSVITNENTPREKQQTFRVPLRAAGELTLIRSFILP